MPGMLRKRISERGVTCNCCSPRNAARRAEARLWRRDWDDEQYCDVVKT